jgi:hypothetical protein
MQSDALILSRDASEKRPYRSLQAAMLLQSFRDAVAKASTTDESSDRTRTNAGWSKTTNGTFNRQVLKSSNQPLATNRS